MPAWTTDSLSKPRNVHPKPFWQWPGPYRGGLASTSGGISSLCADFLYRRTVRSNVGESMLRCLRGNVAVSLRESVSSPSDVYLVPNLVH